MKNRLSRRTLLSAGPVAGAVLARTAGAQTETPTLATIANTEEFLLPGPKDRVFKIQVSHPHPDDPTLTLPITGRKPVPIYVLDGGGTFGLFSTITRYMQWGGELPPCLVVGIGYEDERKAYDDDYRLYDFTPPDPDFKVDYDDTISGKDVGGGPELRPQSIHTGVGAKREERLGRGPRPRNCLRVAMDKKPIRPAEDRRVVGLLPLPEPILNLYSSTVTAGTST